jgi:hypothetical protein
MSAMAGCHPAGQDGARQAGPAHSPTRRHAAGDAHPTQAPYHISPPQEEARQAGLRPRSGSPSPGGSPVVVPGAHLEGPEDLGGGQLVGLLGREQALERHKDGGGLDGPVHRGDAVPRQSRPAKRESRPRQLQHGRNVGQQLGGAPLQHTQPRGGDQDHQ